VASPVGVGCVGGSLKYPDSSPSTLNINEDIHEHAADQPLSRARSWKDLPDDIRARILAVQEKSGFVPNVFLALAHRPAEWRAFFAYHDALMEKDSGLTKAEREMIVVATSNANGCQYCVVAHGAILRIRAKTRSSPTRWRSTTARPTSRRGRRRCSTSP
jgi:AhpD family alkylhydroperoxidase